MTTSTAEREGLQSNNELFGSDQDTKWEDRDLG